MQFQPQCLDWRIGYNPKHRAAVHALTGGLAPRPTSAAAMNDRTMPAIKKCPKCHHQRAPHETEAPERCPACGLYFEKWAMREELERQRRAAKEQTRAEADWAAEPDSGLAAACMAGLRERLTHIPHPVEPAWLAGRALLLAFFCVWGWRLAALGYRDDAFFGSFMHNIVLPIHEAGHIFFMPFGQFMAVLGGSLFQLLFPLIVAVVVLWQNRDPFGAALGMWWCGASFLDLAPYIYDAKNPQLILLGGYTGGDGPHDWIFLLGSFGKVQQSPWYGALCHHLGVLVMAASLAAAGAVLWRCWKARGLD